MLLGGNSLLEGIFDNEVEEEIITTQRAGNFPTSLKVDKKFFVHELEKGEHSIKQFIEGHTFLSSGWEALDMVDERVKVAIRARPTRQKERVMSGECGCCLSLFGRLLLFLHPPSTVYSCLCLLSVSSWKNFPVNYFL